MTAGSIARSITCCLQVVLAGIVNVDGFPLSYETFDGNRADVTTLETVMRLVERTYGQARRVWVFDRGIVSEANLAAIRRRGGQYLVGTRRTRLRTVERALIEGTWTQVRDDVEAHLVPMPGGTETYVLCRSTARREKELAIRRRFSTRLEERLRRLERRVATGRLKDRAKIERALGRLQASYATVADVYEMAVRDDDGRLQVQWTLIEDRRAWRDAREGAYLLRTNLEGQTAETLWTKYLQLTEAEASFRAFKSALAVRPVFHQLEGRVKALKTLPKAADGSEFRAEVAEHDDAGDSREHREMPSAAVRALECDGLIQHHAEGIDVGLNGG